MKQSKPPFRGAPRGRGGFRGRFHPYDRSSSGFSSSHSAGSSRGFGRGRARGASRGGAPRGGRGRGDSRPLRGNVSAKLSVWENLTSDSFVLECVNGIKIPFTSTPYQKRIPKEYYADLEKSLFIDLEVDKLLKKEVIVEIDSVSDSFVSNIFLVPKPDGSFRMIIDLSRLNEFVEKIYFKMDSLQTALVMLTPGAYMASLDLKDAYYSLPMCEEFQNYLVFMWRGKAYKFLCLPFGLSIAPRVFTKVLKPVVSSIRKSGFNVVAYLDDYFLMQPSSDQCSLAVNFTQNLLHDLGFLVNF